MAGLAVELKKGMAVGYVLSRRMESILPNISIGPNSMVGTGSVVTEDVPEAVVLAGRPAKIICPCRGVWDESSGLMGRSSAARILK